MSLTRLILLLAAGTAALAASPEKTSSSFHVDVLGHGRPMILIPGLSSSGHVWDSTVAHFHDRFECHVVTLAGFAGQPKIAAPFLETVRNDLASYIRKNKLNHPVIVGHSLGGFLALWLASQEPDLTGPIVIVDSLPFLPATFNPAATPAMMQPMAEQMRAGMAKGGEAFEKQSEQAVTAMVTRPEDVATVMTWVKASDPAAVGDAMYEMFTIDLRHDISRIKVPVLVLGTWVAYKESSTREQVQKNFEAQYSEVANKRIALAETARHFIMLDDPKWFFEQLDAFLKS